MCDEDKRENVFSVDKHLRIFSAFHTAKGEKLWVITEADRSVTTLLCPQNTNLKSATGPASRRAAFFCTKRQRAIALRGLLRPAFCLSDGFILNHLLWV